MPVTVSDDYLAPPEDNFVGGLGGDNAGDNNLGGGLPTGGGAPDPGATAFAIDQMTQDATNRNKTIAGAGQYNPGDLVAANQGPGTIPNLGEPPRVLSGAEPQTFIKRLDDSGGLPTSPSVPADVVTGTTPGITSGLPTSAGNLSEDDWDKAFLEHYGYFDKRYDSKYGDPATGRGSLLDNAQAGDLVVQPELAYMSGLDSDAKKVYGGIQAHPDFNRSQLVASHGALHNDEIARRAASGEFAQGAGGGGGGQGFNGRLGGAPQGGGGMTQNLAAIQNLQSQQYHTPAGGIVPDSQAFPDGTKIVGELAQLKGVQLANDPIDGYGNIVFAENGQIRHIPMNEWADWGPVIAARLAAQNAPPPAATGGGGGGGYGGGRGPRGNYPPGGGGGGGNPALVGGTGPQSPQALYGNKPLNMAGYGPPDANKPPFTDYGNTNFMPTPGTVATGNPFIDAAYPPGSYAPPPEMNYGNTNFMPTPQPVVGPDTIAAAARYPELFPNLTPQDDTGLAGAYGEPAMPGIPGGSTTLPPRMRRA